MRKSREPKRSNGAPGIELNLRVLETNGATAYLALPNGTAPFPVVLGCHGGYGSKDHFWNVIDKHGFLKPMLSAGYAVFILDALYHGERQVENEHYNISTILAAQYKYTFSV